MNFPATSANANAPADGPALRDIHLPPAPSWWPPAPGWWLLAGLLLILLASGLWFWRGWRLRQRQRQQIFAELERLDAHHPYDMAAWAAALHQMLRRAARRHDATAARQRGAVWRNTLSSVPVDAATLDRLMALEAAIYQSPSSLAPASPDRAATLQAVRQWLTLSLSAKPAAAAMAQREPADA